MGRMLFSSSPVIPPISQLPAPLSFPQIDKKLDATQIQPAELQPAFELPPIRLLKRATRSYESDNDSSSIFHTSSDPALFSSDDNSDLENYSNKRRKKKTYAGTWWGEQLRDGNRRSRRTRVLKSTEHDRCASSSADAQAVQKKKNGFIRNLDSGIFLPSDESGSDLSIGMGSDGSMCEELRRDQTNVDLRARGLMPTQLFSSPDPKYRPSAGTMRQNQDLPEHPRTPEPLPRYRSRLSRGFELPSPGSPRTPRSAKRINLVQPETAEARRVIQLCLDEGKEDIDLSGIYFSSLPPEMKELNTMVRQHVQNSVLFDSLRARPRIYMANNALRDFPAPILDITNLRLLSLRQNKLTTIPTSILKLTKLEELNISGNRIRFLPYQILKLWRDHRLVKLHHDPNPWLQYNDNHVKVTSSGKKILTGSSFANTSPMSEDGSKNCHEIATTRFASEADWKEWTSRAAAAHLARPASLVELVLRKMQSINTTNEDFSQKYADYIGPTVSSMLSEQHKAQSLGGRHCSWCEKSIVLPHKKWTEWQRLTRLDVSCSTGADTGDVVLPFEVMVCGQCGPC